MSVQDGKVWFGTLALLALAALAVSGQVVLIPAGAEWRYLDTRVDQGTNWFRPDFDDSAWPLGPAPLGFGDAGLATVLEGGPAEDRTPTFYFRRPFLVEDLSVLTNLLLRVRRDDGAVVYLNGQEVWRTHMPPGPVSFTTWARWGPVVGGAQEEQAFFQTNATGLLPQLLAGTNWIAVEVHQYEPWSSDLHFDLELVGNVEITNLPPQLGGLALPRNRAKFPPGADIVVQPTETGNFDPDGYITHVIYLANGLEVGRSRPEPFGPMWTNAAGVWTNFTVVWSNVAAGSYSLSALAFDDAGATCLATNLVRIMVVPIPPPAVVITSPTEGASFLAPARISVRTSTSDPDALAQVEFFLDGVRFATDAAPPYAATTPELSVGRHVLSAIATDNGGLRATSAPVTIVVAPAPRVTSLVLTGAVWKYLDTGVDLSAQPWTAPEFDDSAWAVGPAKFGTNDPATTLIQYQPTVYFRRAFEVAEPGDFTNLSFRVLRDDGCVVYLNGAEVFRMNMPAGPVGFLTPAAGSTTSETAYFPTNISPARLRPGVNLLAVELHQALSDDDAGFDLALDGVGPPGGRLRIALVNGRCVLNWSDPTFVLEASAMPDRGYTEVEGAASGYSEPVSGPCRFFRLRQR